MCLRLSLTGPVENLDPAIDHLLASGHDVRVNGPTQLVAFGKCPKIAATAVDHLGWSVTAHAEVASSGTFDLAAAA
jgi:hypothetical protein